jgi:hypothetical protein
MLRGAPRIGYDRGMLPGLGGSYGPRAPRASAIEPAHELTYRRVAVRAARFVGREQVSTGFPVVFPRSSGVGTLSSILACLGPVSILHS